MMNLSDDPSSLYEVLELTPDATPQEIRSAYLRLKSSYSKDNISHYSVFSRDEAENLLKQVEEAYLTLSNPERRKAYDQNQPWNQNSNAGSLEPGFKFDDSSSLMASTLSAHSAEPSPTVHDDAFFETNDWSGHALRRAREARRMTIEDLSDFTRISRMYLIAIEEENYTKLPAVVYVKGFLQQISKRLKLDHEQVTKSYIERLKLAVPDKF